MKQIYLILLLSLSIAFHGSAQISTNTMPESWSQSKDIQSLPRIMMEKVDHLRLMKEDELDQQHKDIPYRFGKDLDTDIDVLSSATSFSNEQGTVYQLVIESKNALSINLIFDDFYLPEGTEFWVYNLDKSHFIGGFTHTNNRYDRIFATAPVIGECIVLEYFQPSNIHEQASIHLSKVIHAYRDIFTLHKNFGSSGSCNNNINCPEGIPWSNEKRAVAMILLSNNSRICTGSLVNNTRQDATPYFLTANHCLGGESTWIFMFNYESPDCSNTDGPTSFTLQGSTLRAADSPSDFALVELSSPPPTSYNVYYAGWDKRDIAADSVVGIHHPSGDIKKISFDYDQVTSSSWGSSVPNSHWTIANWEDGTTEGGSSGSPLFNQQHHIVGQLHGGNASCTNIADDNYGKFSYSWDTGNNAAKRLKDWLDPDNVNPDFLDGDDFNTPQFSLDAATLAINYPTTGTICENTITPSVHIRNNGDATLVSLNINYQMDNGPVQTISWTGGLSYQGIFMLTMPNINISPGNHVFRVFVSDPNGGVDQNSANDTLEVSFISINGNSVDLFLRTDYYADETSWVLQDSLGHQIFSNPTLNGETDYYQNFCLANGCYNFIIYDQYGDGMSGPWWAPSDTGYFTLTYNGAIIGSGGDDFGDSLLVHFCVFNPNGLPEQDQRIWSVFPNPARDYVEVHGIDPYEGEATLMLFESSGRMIQRKVVQGSKGIRLGLNEHPAGIYYLLIRQNGHQFSRKFIISGK